MVDLKYRCRLGNRLFQYAYARIAAEVLGYRLCGKAIAEFPGTREVVEGEAIATDPYLPAEGEEPEALIGRRGRRIRIRGFYQQGRTMVRWRDRVREWFRLPPLVEGEEVGEQDLLIHVRLTDYLTQSEPMFHRSVPGFEEFYPPVIERLRPRKIYLATDEATHPYLGQFQRYNARLVRLGALDTLRFMGRFRQIILSQSTFAWWGAFLGNAERVFVPMPSGSLWDADPNISGLDALPGTEVIRCAPIRMERPASRWRRLLWFLAAESPALGRWVQASQQRKASSPNG